MSGYKHSRMEEDKAMEEASDLELCPCCFSVLPSGEEVSYLEGDDVKEFEEGKSEFRTAVSYRGSGFRFCIVGKGDPSHLTSCLGDAGYEILSEQRISTGAEVVCKYEIAGEKWVDEPMETE
jgi:hypothetical protein